ncbi:hypothetical protein D5F01_LYC24227 [Larimichthys crocea]|uniref:Uncharacterized protein n=2 Tax=Larimichthys crocea TaxID=215358 RepID=A0A6G0HFD3_LARCR|nr:hypothetical protein D5F01_LYC24227 [Larimichthys crocea]
MSSRIVGGKAATKRFMAHNFDFNIPEDVIPLTPDIILYTWVTAYNRPVPAGRPGEDHNYVAKMKLQAATLTDYVHVLFYSRWNMKNEREMLYQVKHRNLIAVCLEDLPDLFPKEMYKYVIREYNAMYFMDYLRQLVMYKATRFREVVRTKCDKERAAVLTGNALMYVDMDIDFHNPPKEWLAPEGVLSFIVVQNTEFRIKVKALNGDLDALSRRAITEASQWMKGENCMVMVCYGKENTFRKMVPVPEVKYNLLKNLNYMIMAYYQQASCISHGNHWTHMKWHSDMHHEALTNTNDTDSD